MKYLNDIIKHGAFHKESVVAPLDPGDAALVAGDEDRGVVALHELPHLKRGYSRKGILWVWEGGTPKADYGN